MARPSGISSCSGEGGFTYLGLLFAVALAGIVLAATGVLWSTERQREKERELLAVGEEFRRAIGTYYERSPGTVKRYPAKLDDLTKDNRFITVQRHLRQVYRDPMTGTADWGAIAAPEGGIMGVHSLSTVTPIKQGNFPPRFGEFEGKRSMAEWRFVYRPVVVAEGSSKNSLKD
ncbi:MAG: type II secretion system pseudopilin PulG [Rhodocyclales bacterium RIFCSPLOWO2_02_FULL_63_24]|nr:MAG: type II secretion system pseudopilin PulG [Rhodocyclales bacterium RIFCSPLOWO2_02_FULL_63_24]